MLNLTPMLVLTVKRDGGTQDVLGFYDPGDLDQAMHEAGTFLRQCFASRRAIVRIEMYNPDAMLLPKEISP